MLIPQLSIFLQDEKGRVARICRTLGEAGINIIAFDLADTEEGFGILRLVVDRPDTARETLRTAHITVRETTVLALSLPHRPSALAEVFDMLQEGGLSVKEMYAGAESMIMFAFDDNEKAAQALSRAGYTLVRASDLAI